MKKTKLFTRILAGFLCVLIIFGIIIPFTYAAEEIRINGSNVIKVDVDNRQQKIVTSIYTLTGYVSNSRYEVLVGGKTLPEAIKADPNNMFLKSLSFFKIIDYQLLLCVDNEYATGLGTSNTVTIKYTWPSGETTRDVDIVIEGSGMSQRVSNTEVFMSSYVIDVPGENTTMYLPFSAYAANGTSSSYVNVHDVSINHGGSATQNISAKNYQSFMDETSLNLGYNWSGISSIRNPAVCTFDSYYLIAANEKADGTYIIGFQTGNNNYITKNIVVDRGNINYNADVEIEGFENVSDIVIDIPTQAEGKKEFYIKVDIYRGEILQQNIPYRVFLSPNAAGISVVDNVLKIEPSAIAGSYTIRVMAKNTSTIYGSISFVLNRKEKDFITIRCADELTIPVTGNSKTILSADVFKDGLYDITEPIEWELGSYYNDVVMSGGTLTIGSGANPGNIIVIARLRNYPEILSKKTITLVSADTEIVPDSVGISGIVNNTWELPFPYGESLDITLYAMKNRKRIESVELAVDIVDSRGNPISIDGIKIQKGNSFNAYELFVNGVYERTKLYLRVYSTSHPNVSSTTTLNINPVLEGTVFTNSKFEKGNMLEFNGMLINNKNENVDVTMVMAMYKDNQLIQISKESKKNTQGADGNSMITLSGEIKLPKDLSGITVKVMLMRGGSIENCTEILAKPLVLGV